MTDETGWVPSQYLMGADEYAEYVQNKLNEKIDKLPVFESMHYIFNLSHAQESEKLANKPNLLLQSTEPAADDKTYAPKFIEKLQPIHTPDGYTVQFECKVEGMPRPQITWFRQTAVIKPSPDFQMYYDDDNVATLIIREVFPEDSGTFTCVAKNSVGFASSTTELTVEAPLSEHGSDVTGPLSRKSMSRESSLADILEGIPPTFSKKPPAQYVDENTNVLLETRLVAIPEPEISWFYNGKEIHTKDNVKVVIESDMNMYYSVVRITKIKKAQEGLYEIVARNREGESRLPITVKVRTNDEEPPQILEPLHNLTIHENESVILHSQIIGNPTPKVEWFKNNKPIKANVQSDGDKHTLALISPKCEDAGVYKIKATNKLGSVDTAASLTIEESPKDTEPPFFLQRFEEQTVPQHADIVLHAEISGNPTPETTWLRNNIPLLPSDRIEQVCDNGIVKLIIHNANSDKDSGYYKCVASSPVGKVSHGARVIVDVEDVVFTKQLKEKISVEESATLILECQTSHYTTTKWYHNERELTGMDHRIVVQENLVHKLIVKDTTSRDGGTYKCTIKGHKTTSTVKVIEKTPQFTKTIQDVEAKEAETAIMEVELTSNTAEIVWLKNGEPLVEQPNKIQFVKDGKMRKLLVKSISIDDEAEYTCQLNDETCSAEMIVIELPPKMVRKLENVTVTKGETATFAIELTKGDAIVRWFKGKREIEFDEHVELTIDGKVQILKVHNATEEDEAKYSCKIHDQISTAVLTVEEPVVEFILPLHDVTLVPKGQDAEFTVKLSQPDVDVTWLKKGKPITKGPKYDIAVEGNVRRLIIKDVDDDDATEITCVAGNNKSTTQVKVEGNDF